MWSRAAIPPIPNTPTKLTWEVSGCQFCFSPDHTVFFITDDVQLCRNINFGQSYIIYNVDTGSVHLTILSPKSGPNQPTWCPSDQKNDYSAKILKYRIIKECYKASRIGGEEPRVAFVEKGRPSTQSVLLPSKQVHYRRQ